jgi:hypothetical protein
MQAVGNPPKWKQEDADPGKYDPEEKSGMQIRERDVPAQQPKQERACEGLTYCDDPH